MRLKVAHTIARSAVNGPGERFVIWVQGCPLACPGCWNPDTWSFKPRDVRDVDELVQEILATPDIEGVTFTGGEPFAQAGALAEVARAVHAYGLSVFIFTGYELQELKAPEQRKLLGCTDVLVTGRYEQMHRAAGLRWRGSSNQRVHFLSSWYEAGSVQGQEEVEVHLDAGGASLVSGFPSVDLLLAMNLVSGEESDYMVTDRLDTQGGHNGTRAEGATWFSTGQGPKVVRRS